MKNNNFKIDLHGKTHSESLLLVENWVMKLSREGSFQLKVITGKSPVLQGKIIKEVLDEWKFNWYIPASNRGMIIVSYDEF